MRSRLKKEHGWETSAQFTDGIKDP